MCPLLVRCGTSDALPVLDEIGWISSRGCLCSEHLYVSERSVTTRDSATGGTVFLCWSDGVIRI